MTAARYSSNGVAHWPELGDWVRAADYDTLRAQLEAAEARADAAHAECAAMRQRMHFLATDGCVEGFTNVAGDIYDYACDSAEEHGRDEPNDDDLTNGLCRLIDAARTKEQQA